MPWRLGWLASGTSPAAATDLTIRTPIDETPSRWWLLLDIPQPGDPMHHVVRTAARIALLTVFASLRAPPAWAGESLSAEERVLLGSLDARRALDDLRRISEEVVKAKSGLGDGTAVSGSVEEAALAADITATLKQLKLDVRTEEFPVRAYRYGLVTLTANGHSLPAISLHAAGGTWGTRDGVAYARGGEDRGHRLRAPLVDLGDGYLSDYARIGDVRGKVVLVRRDLRDWPPAQITEAAAHGARAILFHDHPSSEQVPEALRQDSMWGHEQIPTAAISRHSAEDLTRELAAGPVEIALENRADIADGISRNVVAAMRGSEFPDEFVVVSAHYDRWFQGAADNTSGAAAVLELARAFSKSGLHPRRSILFVATGSEEAGLEDPERDWLAGSYAFVLRHPEVLRGAALVFNVDLLGWTSKDAKLIATPDVMAEQARVLRDLGVESTTPIKTTSSSSIDAWNYGIVGGAAMSHLEVVGPSYYPLYHTQLDVFRPERFENMGAHLRLLALSLWRAASATRLPIALTTLADDVGALLGIDAAKAPDVSFAPVRAALADFRRAAAMIEGLDDPALATAANRLLMGTRHSLVPWLYASTDDFESAARSSLYATRVSVADRTLLAIRSGDRAAAIKTLSELYEGRQCLRLSPEVYSFERAFWAGEGGWGSRFQQRAPPPPPAFEQACAGIAGASDDPEPVVAALTIVRADAAQSVAQSVELMAAKLRLATLPLEEWMAGRPKRSRPTAEQRPASTPATGD